ncbi:MAG: SpoIVB peptidase [Clostridia bacterium]|nr:SpoIVB peptidase [Clostridia bacterium]
MGDRYRRRAALLAAATAALMLSPQLGAVTRLPDEMVLDAGAVTVIPVSSAVVADASGDDGAIAEMETALEGGLRLTAGDRGEGRLTFSLLGLVPLRTVKLSVRPERVLVPGGQSVGVAMTTGGVVVVGNSDLGKLPSPARLAGLKSGDVIQCVNGVQIAGAKQLTECLSGGGPAVLRVLRDGEALEYEITPAMDERDGQYRLGAWVRDSTAGVGTLTYYDPQTGDFGALGHAIADIDTGVVLPVGDGVLYANRVTDVTPSVAGSPGELTGDFMKQKTALGSVTSNCDCGVFGHVDAPPEGGLYPDGLPAASRSQIHTGAATLLTTVDGSGAGAYDCEIVRLSDSTRSSARAMVIRVTDPGLLALSGGIVQGMSGSPLIQDGRLIGAVTHVMVNDPTMGYGICIESMLEAGENPE